MSREDKDIHDVSRVKEAVCELQLISLSAPLSITAEHDYCPVSQPPPSLYILGCVYGCRYGDLITHPCRIKVYFILRALLTIERNVLQMNVVLKSIRTQKN